MSLITMGKSVNEAQNARIGVHVSEFDRNESLKRSYLAYIHENWFENFLDDPDNADSFYDAMILVLDGEVHLIDDVESGDVSELGAWFCKEHFPGLYEMIQDDNFEDLINPDYRDLYDGECLKIIFDFQMYGNKLLNEVWIVKTEWGYLIDKCIV